MATRFYFPETEAAAVSPAIQGTYLHTNTIRRRLLTTPDASTLTNGSYVPDAVDDLVDGAAHHRQYVSDSLAAQTVSGTFKMQIRCREIGANDNQFLNVLIFVCDSAGTTIKETLFAQAQGPTELAVTQTNRSFTGTLTSADLETDDRIVVQIGTSGLPTAAAAVDGHNANMFWGCNASSGDLPENETETGSTFRPWIEFSANLFGGLSPTRGLISWAELETPLVKTRGRVSWAELETPLAKTRGRFSWAEFQVPNEAGSGGAPLLWVRRECGLPGKKGR